MRNAALLLLVAALVAWLLRPRRAKPCREEEAYQAGRLAGYEEGITVDDYPWRVARGAA